MKNISGQYQDLLEGKMTQAQFLRNARMMFPSFVTQHNSFEDSVVILKQKGMLNEGEAVKGTPDKEPTYESPTPDVKTKYKKVEQSPEVDEQDGIYPATTLTNIPKVKANKKVKNESDGLEPIKDNDTKNEMKKVKVVKENIHNTVSMGGILGGRNYKAEDEEDKAAAFEIRDLIKSGTSEEEAIEQISEKYRLRPDYLKRKYDLYVKDVKETQLNERSFDDIFADFVETDDSTEIKSYIKSKGKEAISKIKAELPKTPDRIRKALAKLLKVELDEARFKKGTDIGKPGKGFEKIAKAAGKEYGSEEAGKRVAGAVLNKVLNKESVLEQLVTKIMNETLAKKSAK